MPVTIVQIQGGDTGTLPDAGAGAATSYSITLPASTTPGNQLFLLVNSNATVTTPAGFAVDQAAVFNSGAYIFRKIAVAAESSWTVSPTSAAGGAWCALEVHGLISSPLDKTTNGGGAGGAGTASSGTTATTVQFDEWALILFGSWVTSTAISATNMTNSFFEEHDRQNNASGTNARVGVAVATKTLVGLQTTESTVTWSASASAACCIVTYKAEAQPPHSISDRYYRAGKPVKPGPFSGGSRVWPPRANQKHPKGGG